MFDSCGQGAPPLFTGCIFDVFRYQSRITFESKAYQRRSGASLNRENPGEKRYSLASSFLPSRSRCGILSCKRLVTSYDGEILKKVYEKFGKGIKFALSLHPLKRNEGGETGDGEFTWWWRSGDVDDNLSRRDPLNGGARKKFEKTSKRFGGNDKTPYLCTPFAPEKATAMKMTRRVL